MKYYLVALFDEDSTTYLEKLHKSIGRKVRYASSYNSNKYHIILEIVDHNDFDQCEALLLKILKSYRKFKVQTNSIDFYDAPYKTVKLSVESKGYLSRLMRNINDNFKLAGFNVRDAVEPWDFSIGINTPLVTKTMTKDEHARMTDRVKQDKLNTMLKIEKLEVWKPLSNKKKLVVKSYDLSTG